VDAARQTWVAPKSRERTRLFLREANDTTFRAIFLDPASNLQVWTMPCASMIDACCKLGSNIEIHTHCERLEHI
jgi:hypothetical protein